MSTVYLLGAGFSRGAGAPLLREIMEKGVLRRSQDSYFQEVKYWLDRLFAPRNGIGSLDFEEVLSRLDLELYYNRQGGEDQEQLVRVEQELVSLFLHTLQEFSNNQLPNEYYQFIKVLEPKDRVVNLNYDLIFEKALLDEGQFYPDYQFNVWEGKEGSRPFPVLKPHGSLNMYYCPLCLQVEVFSETTFSYADNLYTIQGCCHHYLRPLILTPTLYKSYGLREMKEIWFNCLQALIHCDRIVFIGYSLPKADILLAQMLDFARRLRGREQEVVVVNGPHPDLSKISALYEGKIYNTRLRFANWVRHQES